MDRAGRSPPRATTARERTAVAPTRETPHEALKALPQGTRIQDGFVRKYLALPERDRAKVDAAAASLLGRTGTLTRDSLLEAWTKHAQEAAQRYKETNRSNAADTERHMLLAALWTAGVRIQRPLQDPSDVVAKAPLQSRRSEPTRALPTGQQAKQPARPAPSAVDAAQQERAERVRNKDDINNMIKFARERLSDNAAEHMIDVATASRLTTNMSREHAQASFQQEHKALLAADDVARTKQLQTVLQLALLAAARPLEAVLDELLAVPVLRQQHIQSIKEKKLLDDLPSKATVKELENSYERAAIAHAMRGSVELNNLYVAALRASLTRERVDAVGGDWGYLANAYVQRI